MEAQEILEDQLARQLTREYIDLLGKSKTSGLVSQR